MRNLLLRAFVALASILMLEASTGLAQAHSLIPADGDNSRWVANSPEVAVTSGLQFTLHFTFENDGTTAWSDAGGYALACDTYYHPSGLTDDLGYTNDCLEGNPTGFGGAVVPPGETITFTVALTAPSGNSGQFNLWYDLEHNGQIFGNNNVYVQVDSGATFPIGSVLIARAQPLLDDMGNPLPNRVCPDGTSVPSVVQSNWDVVELASTQKFTAPEIILGIGGPSDGYVLVAAPDPCMEMLDFSDNQAIEDGTGSIGYLNVAARSVPVAVAPTAQPSLWRDCWPASQCTDSYISAGFSNTLSATGLTALVNGTMVDPHWWMAQDSSGNPAAVYGRDWSAQLCLSPDPVQGCSNQND